VELGDEGHRPPPGSRFPVRPPNAALDLARQEKSLEALGRMLKTKREINGLTRRDVVGKIKIPIDQLESIEDGRLSTLPPVFAKGFLRAYANELGLDAEAILEDYRKMTGGFKNEPANREGLVPRYAETKVSSGGRLRLAAVLFLFLLGLGVIIWFWPDAWRTVTSLWPFREPAPPEVVVRPDGEAVGPPVQAPEAPVAEPFGVVAVASGSLGENIPVEDRGAPAEAEVQGGELILVSQRDGVWLQLIVDGQDVKHYRLSRGQTVTQKAETIVVVRTGQATALTATWNGRDMGALSGRAVVEARFPPG